jgi:hypothetical protein
MMKNWTKEMSEAMIALEGDLHVSAGAVYPPTATPAAAPVAAETRPALVPADGTQALVFSRYVQFTRRKLRLSIEGLAAATGISVEDLFGIEEALPDAIEPRVVVHLAKYFGNVPQQMLELAGLATPRDPQLWQSAFKFAANAEPSAELTEAEERAFAQFVASLARQSDSPKR